MPIYSRKKYQGKIAWCDNKYFKDKKLKKKPGGHYVYIRSIDAKGYCTVSTFVSMADRSGIIKQDNVERARDGELYSFPVFDSTFPRWTALNKNVHTVNIRRLQNIGSKTIRRRHHFMMAKHK